jgi:hypothetical protein
MLSLQRMAFISEHSIRKSSNKHLGEFGVQSSTLFLNAHRVGIMHNKLQIRGIHEGKLSEVESESVLLAYGSSCRIHTGGGFPLQALCQHSPHLPAAMQ